MGPILMILSVFILFLLPEISRIPPMAILGVGIPLIFWCFIILLQGILSLIFYFANQEIMYGMWKKKKKMKTEELSNRRMIMGRRIQLVIVIIGVCVHVIFLFVTVYAILS